MSITRNLDFVVLSRLKTATIDGIGPDMAAARDKSLAALDEAAAEIGDELTHFSSNEPIAADHANAFYVGISTQTRSEVFRLGKQAGWSIVAAFFVWLCSVYVAPPFPAGLSMIWGSICVLAFLLTILAIVKLNEGVNDKDRIRHIVMDDASEIWALGEKAVYSIVKDDVQVIRIDAIGSVSIKDNGILIRSRFGEPTATLSRRHTEKHVLEEIVATIKARII